MPVSLSPFHTSQNRDGTYSLTLPQLTSVFLNEIETLLGPRDPSYSFVGIEIDTTPDAMPTIWFPHVGHPVRDRDATSRHIIIRLTESAQNDANLAIWQLAPPMRSHHRPVEYRNRRQTHELPRTRHRRLVSKHHHPDNPARFSSRPSQIPNPTSHARTRQRHQTHPHNPQNPRQRDRRTGVAGKSLPGDGARNRREVVSTVSRKTVTQLTQRLNLAGVQTVATSIPRLGQFILVH